jgi:hypothetical protein
VTEEDGTPLSADDLEIVLMPKMEEDEEEEEQADEDQEDKAEHDDEEKPKALRIDTRKKAVAGAARMSAPAVIRPKVWSRLKNFQSDDRGDAIDKALRFGHWLLALRRDTGRASPSATVTASR